ncbi:hypothetical protein OCGS_1600 [Oceaniovalibus guishaninsula JLT2003]|uniref:DUF2383 domain-containing protein n=1 Tax=Oceaniovalibus guishaninsula JLT2003 TaxID=1231392 RepID=K2HML3_9RHOB|nr:PA2169 family four-helix-bundle protein [Oceaniovalibus guishaninsula]EKE44084.1 hypothetical protein OCGS_1600 [Oceaniovalibus guishaninsula JLT2003]
MTDHIDAMKDLHKTLIDSRDGYHDAHQRANDEHIQSLLRDLEAERARFAADIRHALAGHDVAMDDDGTILAGAHRVFLNLKDMARGPSDAAILEEIVRGERHLLEKYDAALAATQTGPDAPLLSEQRRAVTDAIHRMEDEHRAAL